MGRICPRGIKLKKSAPKPSRLKLYISIAGFLLLVVWLYWPQRPHQKKAAALPQGTLDERHVPFTRPEADAMMRALFAEIDPTLPKNQYLPEFGRQKIGWVLRENNAKRLDFAMDETNVSGIDIPPLAAASYVRGRPTIRFFIQRLVNMALPDFRAGRGFSPVFKNNLCYAIAHECVHLELGPDAPAWWQPTREQRIQEEMRAWAISDLNFVRVLKPPHYSTLFDGVLKVDAMIQSCNDDWKNCPAFRKEVEDMLL